MALSIPLVAVVLVVVSAWVSHKGSEAQDMVCRYQVMSISMALQMYIVDNGGVFPPADRWQPLLAEYVKYGMESPVWFCPAAGKSTGFYAYNSALSGVALADLKEPLDVIAVFEADASRSVSGGAELLPEEPRHHGQDRYGFVEEPTEELIPVGHTRLLPRKWRGTERSKIWLKAPEADVIWQPVAESQHATAPVEADAKDMLPVDSLVLLRRAGHQYRLEYVDVTPEGVPMKQAEVDLPSGAHDHYLGLASAVELGCLALRQELREEGEVQAYTWKAAERHPRPVGRPSLPPGPGLHEFVLHAYSPHDKRSLVYQHVHDWSQVRVWTTGTDSWRNVEQAYPPLRGHVRPTGRGHTGAATLSPDGSLLGIVGATGLHLYEVATQEMRSLGIPAHLDGNWWWAVAISPDNQEICWVEHAAWDEGVPPGRTDSYRNAAVVILSLEGCESKLLRLSEMAGLPAEIAGFPMQGLSQVAFSGDGQRLYFLMSLVERDESPGLVRYDRLTGDWRVIARGVWGMTLLLADVRQQ